MNFALNNDEFCIINYEFCIKNDAICIKNDENFVLKLMIFVLSQRKRMKIVRRSISCMGNPTLRNWRNLMDW